MTGYTKLFGSIVTSTIWCEDNATRIVWITMLAMRNSQNIFEGSVPGLAAIARVTVDEARAAIKKLESPDLDSRTKEFDGRRIRPVDGGWFILNGRKYRDKMSIDDRREYKRVKAQEYRERQRCGDCPARDGVDICVDTRGQTGTGSTQSESESESKTEVQKKNPLTPVPGDVGLAAKKPELEILLPDNIRTPELDALWLDWQAFRRSKGGIKKWGPFFQRQAEFLATHTPSTAIKILQRSLLAGWTGLFEIPNENTQRSNGQSSRKTDRNAGTYNTAEVRAEYDKLVIRAPAKTP